MPTFTAGQKLRAASLNDAVEGTAPVAVPFAANWGNFGAGWSGLRVWKQGNTVTMTGMIAPTSLRAAATETIGTVAAAYRPTNGTVSDAAVINGTTPCRMDIATNGTVNLAHSGIASGTYVVINTSWSLV